MKLKIEPVLDILQIKSPSIKNPYFLFTLDNGNGDNLLGVATEYRPNDIPKDAHFILGFYQETDNWIAIPRNILRIDPRTGKQILYRIQEKESFFSLVHELRHCWQYVRESDKYYKENTRGMEVIGDIAEIDADAFAIAYCFGKLSLSSDDMSFTTEQIYLHGTFDKGARFERAIELAKEYGFPDIDNIIKIKEKNPFDLKDIIIV